MDPEPGPFGEDQQLGVEEPAAVLHHRQQPLGDLVPDRLEPALGVAETGGEGGAQDQVVGARDELPLRSPHHPRTPGQPGADGQVGVAGDQRGDQREERVEIGGEVDVHIGEDRGVGGRPHRPQGPARAPSPPAVRTAPGQLGGERGGHGRGGVGAGVVGDGDAEGVREGPREMAVESDHAAVEVLLLVVNGDDDVEHGDGGGRGDRLPGRQMLPARQMAVDPAIPAVPGVPAAATAAAGRSGPAPEAAVGGHGSDSRQPRCHTGVVSLSPTCESTSGAPSADTPSVPRYGLRRQFDREDRAAWTGLHRHPPAVRGDDGSARWRGRARWNRSLRHRRRPAPA